MIKYVFKVKCKFYDNPHNRVASDVERDVICEVESENEISNSGDIYAACINKLSNGLDLNTIDINSITLCNKIDCKNRSLFSVDSLKDICNWYKKTESGIINYVRNDSKRTEYTTIYKVNDNIPIFYVVRIPYELPTVNPYYNYSLIKRYNLSDKRQHIICIGRYMVEYDDYIGLPEYSDTPETSLWSLRIYNNTYGFYDVKLKLSIHEAEKILLSEYDMLSNISEDDYIHEDIINYPDIYLSKMVLI